MTTQSQNGRTQRAPVESLTDRELLEEIATSQRETQALVTAFVEQMQNNPMLRMMAGKMGK